MVSYPRPPPLLRGQLVGQLTHVPTLFAPQAAALLQRVQVDELLDAGADAVGEFLDRKRDYLRMRPQLAEAFDERAMHILARGVEVPEVEDRRLRSALLLPREVAVGGALNGRPTVVAAPDVQGYAVVSERVREDTRQRILSSPSLGASYLPSMPTGLRRSAYRPATTRLRCCTRPGCSDGQCHHGTPGDN